MKSLFLLITLLCAVPTFAKPVEFLLRFKKVTSPFLQSQQLEQFGFRPTYFSKLVPGLVVVEQEEATPFFRPHVMASLDLSYLELSHGGEARGPRLKKEQPFFEGNIFVPFFNLPNDPNFQKQWALVSQHGILPQQAWSSTTGSKNILVAVLDTGIDPKHPDLADSVVKQIDLISGLPFETDVDGHGTHVAGTIGAIGNNGIGVTGVNHQVGLLGARLVPGEEDESDVNVIKGIEWAVENGARIANCSFGKEQSSSAVGEVMAAAGEKGLLIAVAAGNDGEDNNLHPSYPNNFRTPNMIVVAASMVGSGLARFSNYGLSKVDLAAPGSNILSTIPEGKYDSYSGTSMATPHVAGAAALVLAANPALSAYEVKEILLSTTRQPPKLVGKVDTSGILNLSAAVEKARTWKTK